MYREPEPLQMKIFANKRMCDTAGIPVRFSFNGIQCWIYPGESCAVIENRWTNRMWDDITAHCA